MNLKRLSGAFNRIRAAFGIDKNLSRKELYLDQVAFFAKQKLGHSFFTKRLTPKTRRKRIEALTVDEREAAQARGWL